jgi:Domain of unknown function (DUF1707)
MGALAGDRRHSRAAGGTGGEPAPGHRPRVVEVYRQQVLGRLLTACADGRLEPAEFAARSQAAQHATTLRALACLIADIPGPGLAAVAGSRRGIRRLILSVLGLAGHLPFKALAARVVAASVLSEIVIDLRRTAVTSFETEITVVALAGEVRLVVPAGFRVEPGPAVTVLGRTAVATPPGRGDALTPVIRLRSLAVLGNVLTSQVPAAA